MKTVKKTLLITIFAGLGYLVYDTLKASGMFMTLAFTDKVKTTMIASPAGLEDIALDQTSGYAILSSHDRRNFNSAGGIFYYNTLDTNALVKPFIVKNYNGVLKPHGISFFETKNQKFLFVISHPETGHEVVKFQILDDTLFYIKTFKHEGLVSPNDLAAVGPEQFYFTNDHGSNVGWRKTISDFLRLKSGNVSFYDAGKVTQMSEKIAYPNGIFWSATNQCLYVSSTLEKDLRVYKKDKKGELSKITQTKTDYALDNIDEDYQGNIYVGGHPQMLKFLGHAKDSTALSPSVVVKFDSKGMNPIVIWLDNGAKLSGLSIALPFQDQYTNTQFLLGSVFERKILVME